MQNPIWYIELGGNTIREYAIAFLLFAAFLTLWRLAYVVVQEKLKAFSETTKNEIDDFFAKLIGGIRPLVYGYLSFFIAIQALELPESFEKTALALLLALIVYQIVRIVDLSVDIAVFKRISTDTAKAEGASSFLKLIARIIIWSVGIILILSNVGINVTSLVAGLGIGGIAIALAVQNILNDLFSSFAIYFDKPFSIGDFIVVGDKMGVVKHIGIKTTRVQALQGEEIVFSNRDLTSVSVQNFKQMQVRRAPFIISVHLETPIEKLRSIPQKMKAIVEGIALTRFDRTHLKSFGDSSLDFEVVYYVESADYNLYMDIQQRINIEILEFFRAEGIVFAVPRQTVFVRELKGNR